MRLRNTTNHYGIVAEAFHWLIAAVIVYQLWLGFYMTFLPRSDPNAFLLVQQHKSIGLTILTLSVLRLLWRLINPIPPLPSHMGLPLRAGARTSHFLLYVLTIGIPLSGWALVSSSPLGLPTRFFGLFEWPKLPYISALPRAQKIPLSHSFGDIHSYLAFSLILLLLIHVTAALMHHYVWRDDVLRQMVPGARVKEGET